MGCEGLCHFLTPTSANNYHQLSHQQHYHRRQSAAAAPSPPSLRSTCTLPTSGMPINPFPSNYHFQEPACSILSMDPNYKADVFSWGAQFYQQPPNVDYGGITTAQQMQEEYRDVCEDVRETMFEKPLTPSDVGKLNRLVIPKQHAERYFPLDGSGSAEPGEKGVQLSFEDEEGKQWRFRYSYWNSSQSYVLTKGWSRFVKEKRLDAGDIVSFRRERLRSGKKLYIGWRRRDAPAESSSSSTAGMLQHHRGGSAGGGPSHQRGPSSYPASPAGAAALCIARQRDGLLHAGEGGGAGAGGSSRTPAGNPKRVRLFGVNLDCPAGDDASDPEEPDRSFSDGGSGPHVLYSSVAQFSSGSSSQT